MKCLLQLLGWEFDGDGEKSDSMTSTVSALGVVVNLSRSRDGVIEIENTEEEGNCQDHCGAPCDWQDHGPRGIFAQREAWLCRGTTLWSSDQEAHW